MFCPSGSGLNGWYLDKHHHGNDIITMETTRPGLSLEIKEGGYLKEEEKEGVEGEGEHDVDPSQCAKRSPFDQVGVRARVPHWERVRDHMMSCDCHMTY